ncbi:MAG TPA: MotA/TolQ/ExbB proton channel family protein [candidate division Zixibacteria bacterium]|nr:MotA/TolQ/ExbB proton channel family protein [candidate division Zixibacteria bacterium]
MKTTLQKKSALLNLVMAGIVLAIAGTALTQGDITGTHPDIAVCISDVHFAEINDDGDTRDQLIVKWKVQTVLDGDSAQLDLSYIDHSEVLYSTTDSTFTNPANYQVFNAGDTATKFTISSGIDRDLDYHYIQVLVYWGDSVYKSEPFRKLGREFIPPDRYTPAAIVFWLFSRAGWNDPLDVLNKSGFLGRRAFDALVLFLFIGCVLLLPRTWWLFRSTRLFVVNRDISGYNECQTVADNEAKRLDNPAYREPYKNAIVNHLSRSAFHGRVLRSIADRVPSFLEIAASNKRKTDDIPSVKLVHSLSNAINSKQNLDDAIDLRVSAEYEDLRKRSLLDVLWALGATAPLLGLFGTVTGISSAFMEISHGGIRATQIMQKLGGGIYEALWTTIFGLVCGILFMIHYYYYSYKLDRIYSVWTSFGADVWDTIKIQPGNDVKPAVENKNVTGQ